MNDHIDDTSNMNDIPKMPVPKTEYIQLSAEDFAALGVQQVAYVKPIDREGATFFEVHAADGTAVAVMDSVDVALATVRQHGLAAQRLQ
jgi:hypothetical protein